MGVTGATLADGCAIAGQDGRAASESASAETVAIRAHDPAEPAFGVFKGISGKQIARAAERLRRFR